MARFNSAVLLRRHPELTRDAPYRPRFCDEHFNRWISLGGNPVGWLIMNVNLSHPELHDCDVAGCHEPARYQERLTFTESGHEHEAIARPA